GDGADSLCLRRNGSAYYIQKSFSGTTTYSAFSFGKSSDVVLCGDWNGDGKDSLCVRRSGNCYYFQKEISDKYSYASVIYGKASSQVYAGKWISADE
ncbi:MAG: hypothetical protein LUF32_06405, partial [Clostridiales bacterium]|nr:hypothetical protein [Clostridiales bacterium]